MTRQPTREQIIEAERQWNLRYDALRLLSNMPSVPWTERDRERWLQACRDAGRERKPMLRWGDIKVLGAVIAEWKRTSPIFALFGVADEVVDKLIGYIRFGEFRESALKKLMIATGLTAEQMGLEVPKR